MGGRGLVKKLIPPLSQSLHKGKCGKIGVIGGSLEYTGAPYYAGFSALKVGADLSHIFCTREAGIPIKSYSPELIVHPVLATEECLEDKNDDEKSKKLIEKSVEAVQNWFTRLSVLIIGPGLGRDPIVIKTVTEIITLAKDLNIPIILDGVCCFIYLFILLHLQFFGYFWEGNFPIFLNLNCYYFSFQLTGHLKIYYYYTMFAKIQFFFSSSSIIKDALWLVGQNKGIVKGNEQCILLPNVNEFQRLQSTKDQTVEELSEELGVIIIEKGKFDKIAGPKGKMEICKEEGSPRRCGGQGDCLSGTVGVFMGWANEFIKNNKEEDTVEIKLAACHAASSLVRQCMNRAFKLHHRGTTSVELIQEIPETFHEMFENGTYYNCD